MADDAVSDSNTETTPPEGTARKTFDEDYVKGLRSEAATHRSNLRAAETERDTAARERDEARTALERAQGASTTAESRAGTAETRALRFEVALEKGLPLELAKRLVGTTREELESDADGLVKLTGSGSAPPFSEQGRTDVPVSKANVSEALRRLAGSQ